MRPAIRPINLGGWEWWKGDTWPLAGLALSLAVLTGCAGLGTQYSPVVDHKTSTNPEYYQQDLADCQALSGQVKSGGESAMNQGAIGALLGAGAGAAIGAVVGNPAAGAAIGGAAGGIGGAAKGGIEGTGSQERAIRTCMRGRGHAVLD